MSQDKHQQPSGKNTAGESNGKKMSLRFLLKVSTDVDIDVYYRYILDIYDIIFLYIFYILFLASLKAPFVYCKKK